MKRLVSKLCILIAVTVNTSFINASSKEDKITAGGDYFNVHFEGDIVLSNNDKDVLSITKGGFIEIKKSSFGMVRRLIIKPNSNGKLIKQFFIKDIEQGFIPKGQKWLAKILPEIVKTTSLGAKSRLNRFYKIGGVDLVLKEIENLKEDFVRTKYIEILLNKELYHKELKSILNSIDKLIEEENYLLKILESKQHVFLKEPMAKSHYIDIIIRFKEDYYKFTLLQNIIKNELISIDEIRSLITITKSIKEENYIAKLCYDMMDYRLLNKNSLEVILILFKQINSEEYYSNSVIKKLANKNLNISYLKRVLQVIKESKNKETNAITFYKNLSLNEIHSEKDFLEILKGIPSNIYSSIGLYDSLLGLSASVKDSNENIKAQYVKIAEALKPKYEHYYEKVLTAIQE